MTVEAARREYRDWSGWMLCSGQPCPTCVYANVRAEAAALAYDLAVAEASLERERRVRVADAVDAARAAGVAWG